MNTHLNQCACNGNININNADYVAEYATLQPHVRKNKPSYNMSVSQDRSYMWGRRGLNGAQEDRTHHSGKVWWGHHLHMSFEQGMLTSIQYQPPYNLGFCLRETSASLLAHHQQAEPQAFDSSMRCRPLGSLEHLQAQPRCLLDVPCYASLLLYLLICASLWACPLLSASD